MPDIFRFHVRQGFVEARGCRDRIAHADEQASDIFAREIAVLAAVDDVEHGSRVRRLADALERLGQEEQADQDGNHSFREDPVVVDLVAQSALAINGFVVIVALRAQEALVVWLQQSMVSSQRRAHNVIGTHVAARDR